LVCKLLLSLYVLKQFPRVWFRKFIHIVQTFGIKCNEVDHLVFYCYILPGKCVYLIVYVDDIIIKGNDATSLS